MSAGASDPPPIAVFLGPSLPRDIATALLPAQFLPPAQFGDVYRLIGSGVRAIVLLDGVFHGRAPVWQRELLCAMNCGIRVYGAASMGALRAAELHTHGMVGLGTVFDLYVARELDGDDEVALLHAGPEQQYRSLTLPLVNVRATLRAGVANGLVEPETAAALVEHLKRLPFWERTVGAMWDAPAYHALDPLRCARVRAVFDEATIDLKRRDAVLALAEVARREQNLSPAVARAIHSPATAVSHHDRLRLLKRCFPRTGGDAIEGAALVERVLAEPAQRRLLRWSLGARFFLRQWALDHSITPPTAVPAIASVSTSPPVEWLQANSLTAAEHVALQKRAALLTWLLEQPPEQFGLLSILQDEELLPTFPKLAIDALRPIACRATIAQALPYIGQWCQRAGVTPPLEVNAKLVERWRDPLATLAARGQPAASALFLLAIWAIEQGPVYFGHSTWSLAEELISELQRTGAAAVLAERWETPDP